MTIKTNNYSQTWKCNKQPKFATQKNSMGLNQWVLVTLGATIKTNNYSQTWKY